MKKRIICRVLALFFALPGVIFAENAPIQVSVSGDNEVLPGDTAVITVSAQIDKDTTVQGLQVNFGYSDNFPELSDENFELTENTTGWGNVGITKNNILGVGMINPEASEICAKITFDIPAEAENGTEYIFKITSALGATADEPITAETEKSEFKITVGKKAGVTDGGGSSSGSGINRRPVQKAEDKTETEIETKPEAKVWENPFSDVKGDDWFYESVKYATEKNLFKGTSETTFSPDGTLTRAMLVTVLYRSAGEPEVTGVSGFNDVEKGAYYENAVTWAKINGIVMGMTETEFSPDSPVLREQIAAIIFRYANGDKEEADSEISFKDENEISQYAKEAVLYCVKKGIIKGNENGEFKPKANATRAETAAVFQRMQ